MYIYIIIRDLLRSQDHVYSFAALDGQLSARANIRRERRQQVTLEADSLRDDLTPTLQRAMNLARERGSSSWLTSLPIKEHGFCLHKSAFVDALALRYGWAPSRTPTTCAMHPIILPASILYTMHSWCTLLDWPIFQSSFTS